MTATPKIGDSAPNFTLMGENGTSVTRESLLGRKCVLYFYPKDDTSGCTKEAIDFNGLRQEFEAAGAKVIGISPDSPGSHDKFRAKHKLELSLASDEDKSACEAFGVWTEKSMYGRRYMGVERSTFLIDRDGCIARIWPKVKVPGHAAEVLEAAKTLG